MEHDDRELAGATRTPHVLHIMSKAEGAAALARVLRAALTRTGNAAARAAGVQLLVVVGDRQTAYDLARSAGDQGDEALQLVPLTVPGRAVRLLSREPRAVIGSVSDLLALVRAAHLKLGSVSHLVVVWPEGFVAQEGGDLDILLAEVPKDGDRTIIADHMTSELEGLVERVAAKPRRLTHDLAPVGEGAAREVGYLITAVEQRAAALQHLLDTRDATGLAVVADDPAAAKDAADALRSLGMLLPGDARVVAASDTDVTAALIVWYGVPESAERIDKLCAAAGESAEIVLLASAADLYRIKALGPRLRLVPLTIAPVIEGSAGRQRAVRDELRRLLSQEPVYADVATIEPLLADYSGAEVAAAAVRLLERERIRMERQSMRAATPLVPAVQRPAPRTERVVSPRSDAPFTRIYLNVGERDGARRGDLVGAITGEAGIAGPQIGRIDMRDTYSLVDIASDVVGQVLERLTGVTIRGRRVSARLDLPREARSGSRPTRGPGAGDRPRVAREHEEWTGRAERLRYSRRPAPDTAAPPPTPPPPPEPERGGGGDAPR